MIFEAYQQEKILEGCKELPFVDEGHKNRFIDLIKRDKTNYGDAQRLQLFYVITGVRDLYPIVDEIYDCGTHLINPETIDRRTEEGTASNRILRRAMHLFTADAEDLSSEYVYRALDYENSLIVTGQTGIYVGWWLR